jgi:hypothetical protein
VTPSPLFRRVYALRELAAACQRRDDDAAERYRSRADRLTTTARQDTLVRLRRAARRAEAQALATSDPVEAADLRDTAARHRTEGERLSALWSDETPSP